MTYKRVNNNRPDRGKNKRAGNDTVLLTKDDELYKLAKELRIKPKTKALYDEIINNPKITQREAYMKLHNSSVAVADSNASKLLRSDKYQIYKASAVGKAKRRVVELVGSNNESIALKASQDILDRTEGKAVQKTENTSKSIEVKIDLGGVRIGAHHVQSITPPQEQ